MVGAMNRSMAAMSGAWLRRKASPPRGGRSASLDHILRDAGLSDFKAELEQLAVDARRSQQRSVNAHPSDQRAQVCVDLRPTSKGVGFPTPVPAEAGSVPSHQGLGPDNRDGVEDCRKPPIQLDEEQTITIREPDTATHLPPHTIVGSHRYSWMKNKRSPSVSPRTFRRNMTS